MIKTLFNNIRTNSVIYANYFLVVYAFFLPLSHYLSRYTFSVIVILFLLSGNLKEKFNYMIKDKVFISVLLFFILHIVWLYGSSNIDTALFQLKSIKYMLYLGIILVVLKKEFIFGIISAFLFAMLISELASYGIFLGLIEPFGYASVNRPVPFMIWYTQYSMVLAISLGLTLYMLLTKNMNIFMKFFYCIFFLSASTNIFIIDSRIGFFLYLIGVFTVLVIVYKKNMFKTLVYSLLFIFVSYLIAYNYSEPFNKRMNMMIENGKEAIFMQNYHSSTGARVGYYVNAFDVIKDNYIFGVGSGDHIDETRKVMLSKKYDDDKSKEMFRSISSGHNANLHSEYLDIIVQFGIIGLIIFFNIFYQVFRYIQADKFLKTIQLLLVMYILISSFGTVIFIYTTTGKIFLLLLALTLNLYEDKKSKIT